MSSALIKRHFHNFLHFAVLTALMRAGAFGLPSVDQEVVGPAVTSHLFFFVLISGYSIIAVFSALHIKSITIELTRQLLLSLLLWVALTSFVWSLDRVGTIYRILILFAATSYAIAVVTDKEITAESWLTILRNTLGFWVVISIIWYIFGTWDYSDYGYVDRGFAGAFEHKNVLGRLSALLILISSVKLSERDLSLRLIFVSCSVYTLYISGAKTPIIAVLFAYIIFKSLSTFKRFDKHSYSFLVFLFILILALMGYLFIDAAFDILGKNKDLTGRTEFWSVLVESFTHQPLFGYGYSGFWTEKNPEYYKVLEVSPWGPKHAHNGYLGALLDVGVLGTVILMMMIFKTIHCFLQLRNQTAILNLAMVIFVYMLILNITYNIIFVGDMFFWVLFVVLYLFRVRTNTSITTTCVKGDCINSDKRVCVK